MPRCLTHSLVGQEVEVDMENDTLTDVASGKVYKLKPLGEVRPESLWTPAAQRLEISPSMSPALYI